METKCVGQHFNGNGGIYDDGTAGFLKTDHTPGSIKFTGGFFLVAKPIPIWYEDSQDFRIRVMLPAGLSGSGRILHG